MAGLNFNRRWFLKGAGAAAAVAALGANVPAIYAQAQAQVPNVTDQDALNLFLYVGDKKIKAIGDENYSGTRSNYDIMTDLRKVYANDAHTDNNRALILAFIAVGGVELANKVAPDSYRQSVDPYNDGDLTCIDMNKAELLLKNHANITVTYDSKKMTFAHQVATVANDLNWSAYSGPHKTGNLTTFVTQVLMTGKSPNAWAPLFAQAGRAMGLSPATTTVAALTVPGQ